jgi:hypothetical protein
VRDVLRGGSLQFGGGSLFKCRDGEEEGKIGEGGRQRM